ncbi:hypothetical protein EI534_47950, partial [Pseudomonas frederiksbergensis]|nr:hypothetical protein [Pseudomonas frederiksbergensis]
MICLAYVTGPAPMPSAPEQAAAKVEYQPLPETALGGKTAAEKAAEQAAAPAQPAASAQAPAGATAKLDDAGFDKIHSV